MAAMSATFSVGLVGVSSQTICRGVDLLLALSHRHIVPARNVHFAQRAPRALRGSAQQRKRAARHPAAQAQVEDLPVARVSLNGAPAAAHLAAAQPRVHGQLGEDERGELGEEGRQDQLLQRLVLTLAQRALGGGQLTSLGGHQRGRGGQLGLQRGLGFLGGSQLALERRHSLLQRG